MTAIISLLVILTLSIIITRIATVAMVHTGLSRESAQFQARSAFTGVGFTTSEAEDVVRHPVRRRILLVLMLLGNAGLVSATASLFLSFIPDNPSSYHWIWRVVLLTGGLIILWVLAASKWVDQKVSRIISWALERWTKIHVCDFTSLLHLRGDYQVMQVPVEEDNWMANKSLDKLELAREGIIVIGIQRSDGSYVGAPHGNTEVEGGDKMILYGREKSLRELDQRKVGAGGEEAHEKAMEDQESVLREQDSREERRKQE